MAINKVVYGNDTLIDLTSDTVTADKVLDGYTFHDASGTLRTGTGGSGITFPLDISDNTNNVTGILNTVNGGTGNDSGYVRAGQASGSTIGTRATAEGYNVVSSGQCAHAEGLSEDSTYKIQATGKGAHAEGYIGSGYVSNTLASGNGAHAEGSSTQATATCAHSEGLGSIASAMCAHAEGSGIASGQASHAEGTGSEAKGTNSHAEGQKTIARGTNSHAQGRYNIEDLNNTYAHIVGNGTSSARSNAHTLDWSGNAWFAGTVTDGTGNVLSNKQDALPTVVNDRYLHTNATTGALEWTQVQGGGGSSATVLGGTLEAGDTQITFTNNAITATAMIDIYTSDKSVGWIDRTVSGTTLTLIFPPQSSDLAVRIRLEETGE